MLILRTSVPRANLKVTGRILAWKGWAKYRDLGHGFRTIIASLTQKKAIMNRREESQSRRRESRSSTRKVSSLSADQLERKRRNDRDSQRANRQKKQQRLDELEREGNELRAQVAEMQVQGEHFRRHTATLEAEIRRLRHELAIHTGQPEVHGIEESSSAYQSGMYLGNDSGPQYVPRARSAIPTSSQGDRSSQGSE